MECQWVSGTSPTNAAVSCTVCTADGAKFQQMARGMPVQAPPQTLVIQPQPPARQYDKLLKYGAMEFKGTVDPLEAEQL